MKKFLFLALGALCGSTLAAKEPPRLLMPDEILSVQGIETNVYFANVFKTVNPDNYFFQVSCPKGKLMKKFWTVTPEKKDIGTYSWTLTVFDDNGKVAEKKHIDLPEQLTDILHCKNPRCITSTEQDIHHIFRLTDKENGVYRCIYCDTKA